MKTKEINSLTNNFKTNTGIDVDEKNTKTIFSDKVC